MDHVTRQFIEIAKKLRDDLQKQLSTLHDDLSHLADGLKSVKHSIDKQQESDYECSHIDGHIAISDIKTQEPIAVRDETKKNRRQKIWAVIKGAFEIAGITAAILYAIIAYGQWQEQIDSTNFAARQTRLTRVQIKESTKNFISDERARVGVTRFNIGPPSLVEIIPEVKIVGNGELENFGKVPAIVDSAGIKLEVRSTPVPEDFQYEKRKPSRFALYPTEKGVATNDTTYVITSKDFPEVKAVVKKRLTMHGIIRYHDQFGAYETRFCWYWAGEGRNFSPCLEHNSSD